MLDKIGQEKQRISERLMRVDAERNGKNVVAAVRLRLGGDRQ